MDTSKLISVTYTRTGSSPEIRLLCGQYIIYLGDVNVGNRPNPLFDEFLKVEPGVEISSPPDTLL